MLDLRELTAAARRAGGGAPSAEPGDGRASGAAGAALIISSKWAGHYDSSFTMKTYVHASDEDLEQGRQALAKIHRIGPVRDCERHDPRQAEGPPLTPKKMALTCGFSGSARAWGRVNRNRTLMRAYQPTGAGERS